MNAIKQLKSKSTALVIRYLQGKDKPFETKFGSPHAISHWRKAIPMQNLLKMLLSEVNSQQIPKNS